MAVASDEGVTALMWLWQKRGHGGGRGVAQSIRERKRKWKVGRSGICFVRVRILGFVIRVI